MLHPDACWCAKLHPNADYSQLGGPAFFTEVDGICKKWMQTRRCSKFPGQSCENSTYFGSEYEVNYQLNNNGVGIAETARCMDQDDCLSLTCQIDLFYVKELLNATQVQFGFIPELNPICEVSLKTGGTPHCDFMTTTDIPSTAPPATTSIPRTTLESPIITLCRQAPMDLVFVVDSSGSLVGTDPPNDPSGVPFDYFTQQIEFMKEVVSYLTIGPSDQRRSSYKIFH